MISRRVFLRRAAAAVGTVAAGPVIAACQPGTSSTPSLASPPIAVAPPVAVKTVTAAPQLTLKSSPLPTTAPTVTGTETGQVAQPRSLLVRATHPAVWQGEDLSGDAVEQMLDAALAAFTRQEDAKKAWAGLFKPGERVAVKVNGIISGSTHVPLVMAVVKRLQEVGIAAENIIIYDRTSDELKNGGFPLNINGPGVRCRGTDGDFVEEVLNLLDMPVRFSKIPVECDALINMPVLKGFTYGGISFAMKNHYGSIQSPSLFHEDRFTGGITGLNALPTLRAKTRLIIADVLARESHVDATQYAVIGGRNAILVGIDPVTVDTIGLQMAVETLEQLGKTTTGIKAQASVWLSAGAELDLGSSIIEQIDLTEIRL